MKKKLHILFLLLFAVLLYLPLSLWVLRAGTGRLFDVKLEGFTDDTPRPALSLQQMASGEFQAQAASWVGEKVPLRGVYTKTYNTLQYGCFQQGNGIIGKNHSVFEQTYLYEYFSMGDRYDFSLPERAAKMDDIVAHMVSANKKLEAVGKHLYVYLAPGKAELCPEDIPANYVPMSNPDSPSALERMTALLKETEIPCLFCEDLVDDLEYPAFYPTGIHWSRTFEQKVSQRLIADFSALTGKSYKSFEFTGVEQSDTPFWRDSDVYDLLNIWMPPKAKYYQYKTEPTAPQDAQSLRIILWGDSYGDGLRYDLADEGFEKNIIYINRDDYVQMSRDLSQIPLGDDWTNLDWQACLDVSDIVVLEMVAPEIGNDTYGFIQALDAYLDTYVPQEALSYYPTAWDASVTAYINFYSGLWGGEVGFSWTKDRCHIDLNSREISQKGLEIAYEVPYATAQSDGGDTVTVSVNGTVLSEKTYSEGMEDTLVFSPENLPADEDGLYRIVTSCSKTFNPKKMGLYEDPRDVGILLTYVGGAR